MNQYLALLRGINVGGKNLVKMADLKECFEAHGFVNVRTYIQSGNVLFFSDAPDPARLPGRIEQALLETFDLPLRVVVLPHQELKDIVAHAPDGFGDEPDAYRYDVMYLFEPVTVPEVMENVSTREGVDQVWAGETVLYFSRLISRASQSRLSKIASTPVYQSMTIRNWKTTSKLLDMMEEG